MLHLALARLGASPDEALFVGDNEEDMAAGKAAGIRTVMLDGNSEKECEKFLAMLLG